LRRLGAEAVEVRLPAQLADLDGLIIPGGESTTIGKLMVAYELLGPLRRLAGEGFPVYGSCAGMILLARHIEGREATWLGELDITVRRNAFGRQVESFEADLAVAPLGDPPYHAVFIRAPKVTATGPRVETLACLGDGTPVAVRQGNLLATSFHPELTPDDRFHRYFLDQVVGAEPNPQAAFSPREGGAPGVVGGGVPEASRSEAPPSLQGKGAGGLGR
jgi:5'-phosphate synthase pdxT subunit